MATNGAPTPPPSDQPATATTTTAKPATDNPTGQPMTSSLDDGTSKRPRDARLIHAVLSSYGLTNYQERVPLQLLDFAYRYTSSILSDSLRLSSEGYTNLPPPTNASGRGRGAAAVDDGERITVTSLRQAIAARQGYSFQGALPKEFMLKEAEDRNRIALPKVEGGQAFGVLLPPEKFCLTGVGWSMKQEWDSEVEEDEKFGGNGAVGMERSVSQQVLYQAQQKKSASGVATASGEDETMGGMEGGDDDEDEEGAGRMEDVFGEDPAEDVAME